MGRRKLKETPEEEGVKKKKPLIPIIIAIVVILAAVAAGVIIGVRKYNKTKYDGKYVCESFSGVGIEYYIIVSENNLTYTIAYDMDGDGNISDNEKDEQTGTVSFEDGICTLTLENGVITGIYDSVENTVTLNSSGENQIVFTKE
jgi:hypothetical protein